MKYLLFWVLDLLIGVITPPILLIFMLDRAPGLMVMLLLLPFFPLAVKSFFKLSVRKAIFYSFLNYVIVVALVIGFIFIFGKYLLAPLAIG